MELVRKRSNPGSKPKTNSPDWSALIPVLPGEGPRAAALYQAIRALIETGAVPPGAKLPTTRDIAARLKTSRIAAVTAFDMLKAEGFAEGKVGSGTYVAADVPHLPDAARTAAATTSAIVPPVPCALGVTVPDLRTQQVFRRLLSRHLVRPGPEHFHYGDPRGGAALREAVANYLRTARGVRCSPDQIMLTSGTLHALDFILRAVLPPGRSVWVEDPCYPLAREALTGAGLRLVGVPVDGEGLDPAVGETLCPDAGAAYISPSHQFPLGVTMSMRRRLALIDWARRSGAWIIEDDFDSEVRHSGPPLTALQGMDGSGRVIYLGTFSKVLLPGLRIAYAVLPEALVDKVLAVRARTDRQPSTLAEGAMADLLNQGHFAAHLRRVRRRARAARDVLVEALAMAGEGRLDVSAPEQGLHLVAYPRLAVSDVDIVRMAREESVSARALSPMYLAAPPRQGLVLGFFGFGDEALRSAASKLGRIVAAGHRFTLPGDRVPE